MSDKKKQKFGDRRQTWSLNRYNGTSYFFTVRSSLDKEKAEREKRNDQFPDKLSDLNVVMELGGSTGAQLVEDGAGNRYVMKRGASADHLRNESEADAFYTAFGANVPEFKIYGKDSDAPVKLSRFLENTKSLHDWWEQAGEKERDEMRAKLRQFFAVDVLLGNWDVVGGIADNILIDASGQPWRVDNGGAMKYRARGDKKTADQWSETGFIDELWTMTDNGGKIGASVSSTIPQYFGKVDVLTIAREIAGEKVGEIDSLRTSAKMDEALSCLSDENRAAVKKRLEETRQLAVLGSDMIDAGHTEEYTDKVLALSYEMSKDGLREAVGSVDFTGIEQQFPGKVINPDYDRTIMHRAPKDRTEYQALIPHLGVFSSQNGRKITLGGREFSCVSEYVASKMSSPDAFNEIQQANAAHGNDAYAPKAIMRKFAVLKSMGRDINNYKTWNDMEQALDSAGFWTGKGGAFSAKYHVGWGETNGNIPAFNALCEGQTVMDAAIQLILENVDLPGNDRQNHTMILFRTESKDATTAKQGANTPQKGENIGQNRTSYRPGACESFGHINVTAVGDVFEERALVVTRVPYSRIHSLWFMENGEIDKKVGYKRRAIQRANGRREEMNFQFWAGFQNEIDACAVDLPIIYVGNVRSGAALTDGVVRNTLLDWGKGNS